LEPGSRFCALRLLHTLREEDIKEILPCRCIGLTGGKEQECDHMDRLHKVNKREEHKKKKVLKEKGNIE
jgi:hypothetical protein